MRPWPLTVAVLKAPFVRLPGWAVWLISAVLITSAFCSLSYLIGYSVGVDAARQAREKRDSAGEAWRLADRLELLRQGNAPEAIGRMEYSLKRAILYHADLLEDNRDGSLPRADIVAMSEVARYVNAYPWTTHKLTARSPEEEERIRRVLDRYMK